MFGTIIFQSLSSLWTLFSSNTYLPPPCLLNRIQTSWHSMKIIQDLVSNLPAYPCHSPGFNVACFSFLHSSWVFPLCVFALALTSASYSSHFPRLFQAHLVIKTIFQGSTQILHEGFGHLSLQGQFVLLTFHCTFVSVFYSTYYSPASYSSSLYLFSPPPFLHLQNYKIYKLLERGISIFVPSSDS